jgi:hypothetical protein
MKEIKIMSCKDFNREATVRYHKDVEDWREGKRKSQPFHPTYIYATPSNSPRKYGYVAKTSTGSVWAKTKKEVLRKAKRS